MLKRLSLLAAMAAFVAVATPADARPEGRGRDRGAQVERPRPQAQQQERVQLRRVRDEQPQPRQRKVERDEVRTPQHEQGAAYEARQKGRIRPLPEIEWNIRRRMPGADYLGPELDMASGIYRLKFLRGDRVIWIDVDGRTGRVVGKSGN